ncbi:hypothetical protein SDC9_114334 [bioreactor metagenome]|uniref:Uncharacterized protein n=1 Tax=bioreactor metagenome TaxID=1076179 RepID=A0A645BQE3_9ZZZZ
MELVGDARGHLGRCALGRPQAVPGGDGVFRQPDLGRARHVWQRGVALGARHHHWLDAPCLDVRGGRSQPVEHHVHIAANQVLQRRARATVGDVGDEGVGLDLEQLARQVMRGAGARRRIVVLAGLCLHHLQELLEVLGGHVARIDHDHLRNVRQQRERHEILFDVVIQLGIHRRRDGVVHRTHEQRIPIVRQLGRDARAHGATRPAAVVDHQRLAGGLGKLRGQRTRKRVGAATCREWHDHGDRLGWPARHGRVGSHAAASAGHHQAHSASGPQHVTALRGDATSVAHGHACAGSTLVCHCSVSSVLSWNE